jgi:transposase
MNAVGIDISKGKSMVAVMRPFGEVVCAPFEISHTDKDLTDLAKMLKSLPGETRVVMEATGSYHLPVAWMLQSAGLYVSVVNALLVHDYGNNSLRRAKTDKKDAVKLANYALDRWLSLPEFAPEEENRQLLKACYRQYQHYSKIQTALSNNLISFLETVFPNVNRLFKSAVRADGSEKWVDFVDSFWHKDCVSKLSAKSFTAKYQKWCKTHKYKFSEQKAVEIHTAAKSAVAAMPKNDVTKSIVQQAVSALRACSKALAELGKQMLLLASSLPEYPVVMKMFGVGPTLGPQLMAEIGDVRRFHSKKALVAYAGIDSPPNDSGQVVGKHKKMSKVGSSPLRRTLFLVMTSYLQRSPMDQPVFQFMNRKRAEGKPYKVYMMASANKFLRIYYATVKAYLDSLNQS